VFHSNLQHFIRSQYRKYEWLENEATGFINTGTWPSRSGEHLIWDSKTWSWVKWDSNLRMNALAKTSSNCKLQTHSFVKRISHKNHDSKYRLKKSYW
jgi:hypothetical protein